MLVRTLAHEAELCSTDSSSKGPLVRALSYAPGAMDTEMQAAAREALPDVPLKVRGWDHAGFPPVGSAGR